MVDKGTAQYISVPVPAVLHNAVNHKSRLRIPRGRGGGGDSDGRLGEGRAPGNPGSDWSTRVHHNIIVYQYRPRTQRRCIVPAHYTHSVVQCGPITRAQGCGQPYHLDGVERALVARRLCARLRQLCPDVRLLAGAQVAHIRRKPNGFESAVVLRSTFTRELTTTHQHSKTHRYTTQTQSTCHLLLRLHTMRSFCDCPCAESVDARRSCSCRKIGLRYRRLSHWSPQGSTTIL